LEDDVALQDTSLNLMMGDEEPLQEKFRLFNPQVDMDYHELKLNSTSLLAKRWFLEGCMM
jgi:hypothetical protein